MKKPEQRSDHARRLYEGKEVPHHSCGICMAAAFGLIPASYQSLRKGGITGEGECGAIKGAEMVIGEYLGDAHPAGAVTPELREAIMLYRQRLVEARLAPLAAITCNHLVGHFPDFQGEERKAYCTELVVRVTDILQEVLEKQGVTIKEPLTYL